MEDLVAVGVADAGHERLVAQQVLELAGVTADAVAPDLERQRRVVGVGTLLCFAPARGPGDRRRPGAGRPCPSGWGRDSGPRAAHRRPAASRHRASSGLHRPGADTRGPNPRTTAVFVGRLIAAAGTSWKRPVSIGLQAMRVAVEVDQQELAAPPDRRSRVGRQGVKLGRRASHRQRTGCLDRADRSPGERRVERVGDHGQIGQFGHGAAIVAAGGPVLDSPGPKGHGHCTSDIRAHSTHGGADRGESITTDHPIVSDTA